jgi:hypothetical protein
LKKSKIVCSPSRTILSTIVMSNSGRLVAAVWRSLPSKQIEQRIDLSNTMYHFHLQIDP